MKKIKILALICLLGLTFSLFSNPHTIIRFNGKKDRWSNDAIKYLTEYLTKSTDEVPKLNQNGNAKYIINLEIKKEKNDEPETFRIKSLGNNIIISGATSLALRHGVFEFLEQCLGIRWLFVGKLGEHIPKTKTFNLPKKTITMTPTYLVRSFAFSDKIEREWAAKNKGIFHYDYTNLPNRPWFHHMMWNIVSSAKYGKTNPEFFPILKNERMIPPKGYNIFWQNCFTAKNIVNAFTNEVNKEFKKNKNLYTFSFGINDGKGFCECKNCLTMDKNNPDNRIYSYLSCFDQVAKNCYKPGRTFGFLAYGAIRLAPNDGKKYHHSLKPFLTYERLYWSNPARKAKDQKETLDWHKTFAGDIGWYDYFAYKSFLIPKISLNVTPEALRWGAKNHVKYYYAEAYPSKDWHTGPMLTILLKLLWNPEQDVNAILHDWCVTAVGPKAAVHLENYFKLCSNYWEDGITKTEYFRNPDAKGQQYMNMGNAAYLENVDEKLLKNLENELKAAVAKSTGVNQQRAKMFYDGFKKRLPDINAYLANKKLQQQLSNYKFTVINKDDFNTKRLWTPWQRKASKGKFYYSNNEGINNSGAMAMDFNNSYKDMTYSKNFKVKKGNIYRVTIYTRNIGSLPGAQFSLRIAWGAPKQPWLSKNYEKTTLLTEDGSYSWNKMTVAAKAPNVDNCYMKVLLGGSKLNKGQIFFDNLTIEEAKP